MHKKKPNIFIKITDCSFKFKFDYHIKTTPELLEDVGVG